MANIFLNISIFFISSRVGPKIERVYSRHLKDVEDRKMFTNAECRKETTLKQEIMKFSTNQRRDHTRPLQAFHEDGRFDADDMSSTAERQPSSRVRYC